jgi:hypothetical protein
LVWAHSDSEILCPACYARSSGFSGNNSADCSLMKMENYYCRLMEIPFVFTPLEQINLRRFKKVLIAAFKEF